MKYTLAFALLAIISIGIASCSNESTYNNMSEVPQTVQTVVSENFPSEVLSTVVETNSFGNDEYEIILQDGTKVKFEGEVWDEVKVPAGQSVPSYFVLEPIQTYVTANMPGQTIVKIDREDNGGYEIGLSNGVEVKFDASGNFIKID